LTDFSDFLHEVIRPKCKNTHRAGFLKKGLDHSKIAKNCVFWPFLVFLAKFLKNGSNDFSYFLPKVHAQ